MTIFGPSTEAVAINHYLAVHWSCSDEIIMLFARLCGGRGNDRKKRKPVRCDRRDPDRRRMCFSLLCCPGPDGLGRATGPIIGDASVKRARRHKPGSTDLKKKSSD